MFRPLVLLCMLKTISAHINTNNEMNPRIIGGLETTIEEHPYQVSVRFYGNHICGGAIIDESSILTAAKCVAEQIDKQSISILAGSTHVKGPGQVVDVEKIILHDLYNAETSAYNLAILKLQVPLVFSDKIQAIPLQQQGIEVLPATIAKLSGWGSTNENNYPVVDILHYTEVDTISNDKCQRYYQGRYEISSSMLCSNNDNHDACGGDYGGPLVAWGKLAGIISWSIGCGHQGNPRIYAKISEMHDWIQEHK